MRNPVKQQDTIGHGGPATTPHGHPRLRAKVLIPKDSPIAQIEIEVMAALLDDWESLESSPIRELSK